ncbi:geranylgeranyl transferas-like protein type i beta subunit [Periconia macrospinosa]|uniref:Geranylgeranyl transferas-like protein type i beta subunit n=1 Tax=Periconia macrospinosa TaxID=97972 RepID=A0A2V1DSN4_9PLEO|nr:geranylgeranyl transferas-like protein type i beta subunit [Periconia macrospinosa]
MSPAIVVAPGDEQKLNYSAHIRYWRRNLKTFLPHHYTGNDANRMILGLFILSALDILGDLPSALSPDERKGYIDWVYHCQLPEGGFRPAPATYFGDARNDGNKIWDPAHVPGTFFALSTLVILGDDLERVKRKEILTWLNKMQKSDGGFGETLGDGDQVKGGNDSRFGYMAAAIRWILRGTVEGPVDGVPDIQVDQFVQCVRDAEAYDGGLSEAPYHEAHAGFTSCAISALSLLDRLPVSKPDGRLRGLSNLPMTLHWLVSRQTMTIDETDARDTLMDETDSSTTCHDAHSFVKLQSYPSLRGEESFNDQIHSPFADSKLRWVGINGRLNKIGDTCYAYYVMAPLFALGYQHAVDKRPIRRWLVEKNAHMVGGFGKAPGDHPDIYHSFLGLMVLSMFGEAGLQDVDVVLCITNRAKRHLESLPWRRKILGMDPV